MAWPSVSSSAHSYVVSGKGSDLSVPGFLSYKVGAVTALSLGCREARQPEPWEQSPSSEHPHDDVPR